MKLVVGLGNPGKQYEKTRHNIGFMIMDAFRESLALQGADAWSQSKKFNALVSGCTQNGEKIILAKPLTFMNGSGYAVQVIGHFYKLKAADLIVVHDDKDLPLGEIKVQTDRGHAGHNGVRSIIESIGSKKFTRVRVGIKSKNPRKMKDVAKFVLNKFSFGERKDVRDTIEKATQTLHNLLEP